MSIDVQFDAEATPLINVRSAALELHRDLKRRFRRLLPVVLITLAPLIFWRDGEQLVWITALETLACVLIALVVIVRRRLPTAISASVVTAGLLVFGVSEMGGVDVRIAMLLGLAIMLSVAQITVQPTCRWCGNVMCAATYLSVSALAFIYLFVGKQSFSGLASNLAQWTYLSVVFASFAFVVLVETEKMFMRAFNSQQPNPISVNLGERPLAALMESNRDSFAADIDASESDRERLRLLNRQLETVAYVLSHDLRAPLRAIDGYSRALAADLGESLPEAAARDLLALRSGIVRFQTMIEQWLSFIAAGTCDVHRERVDLTTLSHAVVDELRAADPHRKTVISVQANLYAYGDAIMLRQVMQNLIGNAWKFTQQNDEHAMIEVGVHIDNAQIGFFVRDNGLGFDAADAQRLFAPFIRLHNAQAVEGTGVGLAIVRSIIEAHGGTIWAQGNRGIGAQFNFTLPDHNPISPGQPL